MDARNIVLPDIFKTKTVISVDMFRLNEFIAEKYGIKRFDGHLESPNDSTHEYDVENAPLPDYDEDTVKEAIDCGSTEHWQLGTVLQDLCVKGHLPAGTYIVRVCW